MAQATIEMGSEEWAKMMKERDRELVAAADRARAVCRCHSCQGGYPIGEFTLAGLGCASGDVRPASCLAEVVMMHLLGSTRGRR
jgi:hypothetical protein